MATARLSSPAWIPRLLDLPGLLAKRSHFLFGPLQTGKISLVRHSLKEAKVYDLLCVALEPRPRTVEGITVLPFKTFLEALWAGEYR